MITDSTNTSLSAPTPQAGLLPTENTKPILIAEWLLPVQELEAVSSKFFGRNIHASIQRIKNKRRPLGLKLRNKLAVIIIDNESYEELVSLKDMYIELVEQMKQSDEV
jgi:PHD/YefM family antitoxin component YafN of YafNO toxin-antitoxin module